MKQPPVSSGNDVCNHCTARSGKGQLLTQWKVRSVRFPEQEPFYACGVHLVRAIHYFTDRGDEVIVAKHVRGNDAST